MSELSGLLSFDDSFNVYDALEEMHEALCCADVAELIDNVGVVSVVEQILFYVKDPAAEHALNVFLTKLKSNEDAFYKTAPTV